MSKLRKLLPQTTLLVLIGALVVSLGAASSEPDVELTLRARDMAFYLDGDPHPNPELTLPADRRVRLTFINEDRGVAHDLLLSTLGVRSALLAGDGSSQVLRFRTPSDETTSSYSCSLHPMMMTAALQIR